MTIETELNTTHVQTHEEWLVGQINSLRLKAYSDPLTGSDRYFAEATRLEAAGDTEGADVARASGLVRYDEIRDQYPWPETAE